MSDSVLVSIITGICTVFGVIVTNNKANQSFQAQLKENDAITNERLMNLTRQVERHNGVIERTYKLEEDVRVLDERIKVANNRIADLERK